MDEKRSINTQAGKGIGRNWIKKNSGRVGVCRESLSVLGCINAAGSSILPMVIVKGKTPKSLNVFNVSEGVPNTNYTYQDKAWMENVSS